jgi:hypothetical protein
MDPQTQQEREVRAARNQSLFRALNRKLETLNESMASVSETFTIACECADAQCVEMIDIRPDDYEGVRADPRRFAVLPGHVYPDVEEVVAEHGAYVVVEKGGTAAVVAEALDGEPAPASGTEQDVDESR